MWSCSRAIRRSRPHTPSGATARIGKRGIRAGNAARRRKRVWMTFGYCHYCQGQARHVRHSGLGAGRNLTAAWIPHSCRTRQGAQPAVLRCFGRTACTRVGIGAVDRRGTACRARFGVGENPPANRRLAGSRLSAIRAVRVPRVRHAEPRHGVAALEGPAETPVRGMSGAKPSQKQRDSAKQIINVSVLCEIRPYFR